MKLSTTLIFLLLTSLLFAQQKTNSIINYQKSKNILVETKRSDFSLNLNTFRQDISSELNNSLAQLLKVSKNEEIKSTKGIPVFAPIGIFHLNILKVHISPRDIDTIYDFENSIYFLRNAG